MAPVDTRPKDRAEREGLPPDSGPEQDVRRIRAAMLRTAPIRFVTLTLVVLGAIGYGGWLAYQDRPIVAALIGVIGLGAVGYLVYWKIQTYATRLRVTNKRTVMTVGLLSKATTEVLHDNIRNVKIDQSFWERVWNVGRVSIASSGTDEEEIEMSGVPSPHELARIVDLYRPLG
ncbi:MAG: PH domain-containing protein [Planctomycetota bacterium]